MAQTSAEELNLRRLAEDLNRQGRKRFGEVTLTENADATTVTDLTVTEASGIFLMPLTDNANIEKHETSPYCFITRARGSFEIAHANNSQTDRTFFWFAVGG